MKKLILIIISIIIFNLSSLAQIDAEVKKIVKSYPKSISNPEKLASLINRDFESDLDKVGAIYIWITNNISYDVKTYYSKKKVKSITYKSKEEKFIQEKKRNNKVVKSTLKKRMAVCDGYSRLFKTMCDLTEIECVIISGSSKTTKRDIGKLPRGSGHAWNAVKIDNKWSLIDATWGAGRVNSKSKTFITEYDESYFFTDPELFFLNHYPKDSKWLLIQKTKQEFANLPLFYPNYFNSGLIIKQPSNGIITSVINDKIKFHIISQSNLGNLTYAFNNEKYATTINIEKKDGKLFFEIPVNNRKTGYLGIYNNLKGIALYKLNLN